MKTYPLTTHPIWGSPQPHPSLETWQTERHFDAERPTVQEVVPAYSTCRATLTLEGARGDYALHFPGGNRHLSLTDATLTVDVSHLVTTGKHLYHIDAAQPFDATLTIRAERPMVSTHDEGYRIDWQTIHAGERQQMVGDRPAHRVGTWSTWAKFHLLPQHHLLGADALTLDAARYHAPHPVYEADFSGVDVDDSAWQTVSLPTAVVTEQEGFAWYRLQMDIPAAWASEKVIVSVTNVSADVLVYVNGHTVGFGQRSPAVFEVSDYLRFGDRNQITIRVSHQLDTTFALHPVTVAPLKAYGFGVGVRLYPSDEDALSLDWLAKDGTPIRFSPDSTLHYRPPELRIHHTEGHVLTVLAAADANQVLVRHQQAGWLRITVEADKLGFSTPRVKQVSDRELHLFDATAPDKVLRVVADAPFDWQEDAPQQLALKLTADTTLCLSREDSAHADYVEALQRWQDHVYGVARPHRMTDTQAAAWRSYKQTVLFNARRVADDALHGLLAAFDKPVFHVYWMRDCAISVPGALYTGGVARQTALDNVGPTLDRYVETPASIGVYPDGTPRAGNFSDGPALGITAQGYAWALEDDTWLAAHYDAVEKQLAYLMQLDSHDGDALDGFIRSSQGDWKDAGSMDRLWRVGAVLFVNVCYLRALRVAADMATALGKTEQAQHWENLRQSGIAMLNRPVDEGGLWMPDRGYYAEWVQIDGEKSWVYPRDIDQVTVFAAFAATAHGMALAEGIIPPERIEQVCAFIEREHLLTPLPAPAQFPFYDVLAETGQDAPLAESLRRSNPWQLKDIFPNLPDWLTFEMVLPWKGWAGNHVWGGRWMMSGAWLTLGLWRAGKTELATLAQSRLAEALRRTRHPGRCEEVESFSAVSREETGSHADPSGYYQLWSGAVPLQALVEGAYGVTPTPTGVFLDVRHCTVGDGIQNVPIRGGTFSYQRLDTTTYQLDFDTDTAGELFIQAPTRTLSVDGLPQYPSTPHRWHIAYDAQTHLTLTLAP